MEYLYMDTMQVAQKIKTRCKEKGYTIKEVLDSCEISKSYMYDLKRQRIPSIESFLKIAEYLDCSIDYLIGRTDNPDINK